MYDRLQQTFNGANAPSHRQIDVIGFSRGAAMARHFAGDIFREGVFDKFLGARVIPGIRFLGVFDTVGSFGMPGNDLNIGYDVSVPPNVLIARHAMAANEYRETFPLTRLHDPKCGSDRRVVERIFEGAHSDIGGGYENDYLSRVPLQWMWEEMTRVAGIKMLPVEGIPAGASVVRHRSERGIASVRDWVRVAVQEQLGMEPRRGVYYPPCKQAGR